ncbi:MAG: arylsulfotransferase family protein [Sphingomonas sp.]|jgi:hypothetical protein|uniref:arylsulfotransferase family protein n=1 Tax=Sphingomonas sp. TaxID=28214 RepID=UPI0035684657
MIDRTVQEAEPKDNGLERLMFARISVWKVLLGLVFGMIVTVILLAAVRSTAFGGKRFGLVGEAAMTVASIPATMHEALAAPDDFDLLRVNLPYEALPDGFSARAPGFTDPGFLLVARSDPKRQRSIVQIVRVRDGKVLKEYAPDILAINARSTMRSRLLSLARDRKPRRYRMFHPFLLPDGGIIFQGESPLVRIDACGKIVWTLDGIFSHAIEQDGDGNFWVAYTNPNTKMTHVSPTFRENEIAHISPAGKILSIVSLVKIFHDNGLEYLWRARDYTDEPFHLNDIQPVLKDGKYWKAGDLLISLRNLSMIMLYRPSTGKIIWSRDHPWRLQHDVNIIDDHRISVFDNNVLSAYQLASKPTDAVDGHSRLLVYDFATDSVSSPFESGFANANIRASQEGRGTLLPNGDLFVEETQFGRMLRLSPDNKVRWQYIDADDKKRRYMLNWSRYLDPTTYADSIKAGVSAKCT